MKTFATKTIVAACMMAAAPFALAQVAAPSGNLRTGKLFDLTVGVGSTYDAAQDAVTGGITTAPAGFTTVNDLFDAASETARLREINSAYTDTSASVIRLGYRGLPVVISTAPGSSAVQFLVPAIGESRTFSSGATRDENIDQLEEYLKDNGGDILSRMQRALVRFSPVDPVAGNPGSLQTQMVNSDFDRAFLAFASNVAGEGAAANNNLIGVGAEFGSFTSGGARTQSFTLPLSYVVRFDADPRKQLTVYAPIMVNDTEGAISAAVRLGVSYRFPVSDNWSLTPGLGYGITGSVDMASAAAMMAGSLTSQYTLKFRGFDVAIGNAVGVYQSQKIKIDTYSYDPGVKNTVFRNGVLVSMPTMLMGQRMAYELSYINTIYNGTELYSNKYNEFGITVGTNRGASSARSYLRAGASFFKGERDVKGGKVNIGYWF